MPRDGMPGEGLALTAFTDIQLDIDGDAAWDSDLIDEKQSRPQSAGHGPQRRDAPADPLTVAVRETIGFCTSRAYAAAVPRGTA